MQDASNTASPAPALRARPARHTISGFGICLGLLFFAASLTPSLVPRDAIMQGILGGALFAIGYGIAVAALALWRWLELAEPDQSRVRLFAFGAAFAGVAVFAYALSQATGWQNAVRAVMGLDALESNHPLRVLGLAAGTAFVLFLVSWLLRLLIRLITRRLRIVVPPRVAGFAGLVIAFSLFGALINGVLVREVLSALDSFYARLDQLVDNDQAPPAAVWQTGSTASIVPWDTLGRDGRRFIDSVTLKADLERYWSRPAEQPLRIYVGLNTADDPDARAAIALAEMKRVGAFERDVLVVAIPTGTGFMDQGAIAPLEYITGGDVATVAMQYSYLQSPFSLIFEPGYGAATGRALLRTVYDHWHNLPRETRPKLYLFGLSLGTLSSEQSVRLHEVIGDPFNGALWAGPPFLSPIHTDITQNRMPDSPAWLPVFEDGAFVRTMNQTEMTDEGARWGPMRIVYLQHGSDPIVFFSFTSFWRRPDWMRAPRAPDVTPVMRWWPLITGFQLAADMALSNNVPLGYGHQYSPRRYLDAWNTLIGPELSPEDLARLEGRFDGPR